MKRNKLLKLIFIIFILIQMISNSFCANIATIGLDPSLMATYLAEDESENAEIVYVVDNFINNFIKPEMSDFEKEIQIIRYLVATVSYDMSEIENENQYLTDSYKAYGALVNGKAVCSGYAKAFDLLAKKCGLSSTVVTGTAYNSDGRDGPHAWNQIYLDGDWYNVDVTFEDPITNIELNASQLFNNYINRTDAEFSNNHIRDNGHDCIATKYGKNTVSYYLTTGIVDFNANVDSVRKMYEMQIENVSSVGNDAELEKVVNDLLLIGAAYDDGSNVFLNNNDLEITTYILTNLVAGKNVITFVTGPNTKNMFTIDTDHWMKDYITIPGRCSMQKIYSSDGKYDTRVLIFKWG